MSTYVLEHKTTSEDCGLGSVYWQKLQLDAQVSTYLVGARSLGHEPDGVLYDVLRKPALRPYEAGKTRKVAETPEEYRDRCMAAIVEKPDAYYQRGIIVRLEQEEIDAAFDVWQTAEAIRMSRNAQRWPRNVDSCEQYHRLCDYWAVCSGQTMVDDPLYYQHEPSTLAKVKLPLLSVSSARTYRACPRRYYYSSELRMRPRRKAESLSFGTTIHKALEVWLPGHDLDAALSAVRPDAYDFNAAKAEAMLRGYHARWDGEAMTVLGVEAEFAAPLVNPETGYPSRTWMLGGKLDGIVQKS